MLNFASIFRPKTTRKRARRRVDDTPAEPRKWLRLPEARDVFLFGGMAAASYGVYQIYPPSAYVLAGGFFMALGVLIYMGGSTK